MTAISQMTFPKPYSWKNRFEFYSNFTDFKGHIVNKTALFQIMTRDAIITSYLRQNDVATDISPPNWTFVLLYKMM